MIGSNFAQHPATNRLPPNRRRTIVAGARRPPRNHVGRTSGKTRHCASSGNYLLAAPLTKASLKVGDKVASYAQQELHDVQQLRQLVLATRGKVPISVTRASHNEPVQLTIEPAGDPVSLGLAWRVDEAEPGSVLSWALHQALRPTKQAVKLYDRVYEINGRRFTTSDEFRQLTNSLPSSAGISHGNSGKIRKVTVKRLDVVTGKSDQSEPTASTSEARRLPVIAKKTAPALAAFRASGLRPNCQLCGSI